MILIADSGSTKTDWCLVKDNGELINFSSEGYNPCYVSKDYITQSLKERIPNSFDRNEVREVALPDSLPDMGKSTNI